MGRVHGGPPLSVSHLFCRLMSQTESPDTSPVATCAVCGQRCRYKTWYEEEQEEHDGVNPLSVTASVWRFGPMKDPADMHCVCNNPKCVKSAIGEGDWVSYQLWHKVILEIARLVPYGVNENPTLEFVSPFPKPSFRKDGKVVGVGQTREGVDNFLGYASKLVNDHLIDLREEEVDVARANKRAVDYDHLNTIWDEFKDGLKELGIELKGFPQEKRASAKPKGVSKKKRRAPAGTTPGTAILYVPKGVDAGASQKKRA